jgi:hypothetical protein
MKGTGIFVTKEELSHVEIAYKTSGMIMDNDMQIGNPEWEVYQLTKKYNPPAGSGLNIKTGEFVLD